MPIVSPLYNVLKNLVEKTIVIPKYNIKHIEQDIRSYFLIELDAPNSQPIIKDYNLLETHFSIDELYNPGVNSGYGYTPMHYTEVYFSQKENKYIVIHGYVDSQGEYKYAQVKELNEFKEFAGTFIALIDDQENMLKKNIKPFKPFVDAVLDAHIVLKRDAKEKADQLERNLTKLSRELEHSNIRVKYIKTAKSFIKAVKTFNQYSEVKDVRDKIVLRMFKNIEIINRCIEGAKQEFLVLETPEPEEKELAEESGYLPKAASLSDLYKITMQDIKSAIKDIKKIKTYTIENLVLFNKYAEQIYSQILIFYSFPNDLVKKQKENSIYIHNAVLKLNEYYAQYLNFLKNSALKSNLSTVKEWFPLLKNQITDDFYSSLLEILTDNPWNESILGVLNICDYLSENDINYRAFILKITQEKRYPVSKAITRQSNLISMDQCDASLLFNAHLEDKLDFFKTLLRHGASPNTWGMTAKTTLAARASLFAMITSLAKSNYLKYLEILLLYKVDPNENHTKSASIDTMQLKLNNVKAKLKSKDRESFKPPEPLYTKSNYGSFTTVKLLIERKGFEGLNLISNIASPSSLAHCLANLLEDQLVQNSLISASSSYGIYCGNTYEGAVDIASNFDTKKSTDLQVFPSYVCFPYFGNNSEDNILAEEFLQKIALVDKKLTTKIVALESIKFQEEYKKLFKNGEEEITQECWADAFCSFIGCEFLIMKRGFSLFSSQKEIKSFIRGYSRELYDYIIMIIPKIFFLETKRVETMVASYRKSQTYFLQFCTDKSTEAKNEMQELREKYMMLMSEQDKILPFCEAARDGNLETLQRLLEKPLVSLDAIAKGWTPLHFACAKGRFDCAKKLIESGASIDIPNYKGRKAFDLLKNKAQVELLKQTYARMHPS